MNNLFVKDMQWHMVDNKLEEVPIYGNFCPRCSGPSDRVHCYDKGLLNCHNCDHIFTMLDMKKIVTNFWEKRNAENKLTGLDAFL